MLDELLMKRSRPNFVSGESKVDAGSSNAEVCQHIGFDWKDLGLLSLQLPIKKNLSKSHN